MFFVQSPPFNWYEFPAFQMTPLFAEDSTEYQIGEVPVEWIAA
jgi:hypothetical protein